jgi:two-component system, NtrC family, response regulator AtoC
MSAAGARERPLLASAAMRELMELVDRVAPGEIHVLLLGETGVGKEVFAGEIHARSRRAARPLIRLNCAAFTETLFESELFGHEKGAFSGAGEAKAGLLESADGGTVFFDEVGEMPLALQAKLLRVLEEQQLRRVGGLRATAIDVRFVCATNRDLEAEIRAGRFRRDLYYRLNGISLTIPPLRERREEIVPLAQRFLELASRATRGDALAGGFGPDALAALESYDWPGNIRELRNVVARATLLADGAVISRRHLPVEITGGAAALVPPVSAAAELTLEGTVAAEHRRVSEALALAAGNQSRAARLLGVSRTTLIAKIEKYGLPRPRKREP